MSILTFVITTPLSRKEPCATSSSHQDKYNAKANMFSVNK